jgi:hypothetical protein
MSMEIATPNLDAVSIDVPERGLWTQLPRIGAGIGIAGLGLTWLLGQADHAQAIHSYLVAFLFFLSLGLGGLFFVVLQFLVRAGWSVTVRRLAEHVMATLPIFAVLFIPIALGVHELYHWSHADAVAHDPILQHKAPYLDVGAFHLRAIAYFVVWSVIAVYYWRQSQRQDQMGAVSITRRLQVLSPLALIGYALTQTFASFDWLMSLDPHWFSTIFGVYFFAGSVVSILAVLILLAMALQRAGALRDLVTWEHFHDLGKLLLGFVVFWAYIAFSQFMLIWYANIPEETEFFAARWNTDWKGFSIFLAVGHFVLPFFFLLLRDVKRRRITLVAVSLWLLAMHYVDLYWLVMPNFHHEAPQLNPLDITALIGVGGVFLAVLANLMRRRPLIPVKDPRLAESLLFENA